MSGGDVSIDDIIKKMAPLPVPMVKDILIKVGGALGYGHRREVVHRDIKPANIMIDEEGTPIVTDFGIAKVANEGGGLTMTGTTIGTPSYMSPEQCEAKEVSGASNQYSLGVLAWEMLTGKLPFEGQSAVSTMYMHCHEPLPPLLDFRPDCPAEVMETVERRLAGAGLRAHVRARVDGGQRLTRHASADAASARRRRGPDRLYRNREAAHKACR